MKKDLADRADIKLFVQEFYHKLLNDNNLKQFFNHILEDNHLDDHLETITDFWEDILFLTANYGKNAMKPHVELHQRISFKEEHFELWLGHFKNTIDHLFEGEKCILAKNRATSIAIDYADKIKELTFLRH